MGLKESIKNDFKEDKNKLLYRYKASKMVFLFFCLLFFISFYFAGAGFYREFSIYAFSFLYILVLFTLNIYIFFFFKNRYGKLSHIKNIILYTFMIILTLSLMFPIIFDGGLIGLYNKYMTFDIETVFTDTIEDIKNMLP